MKFWKIIRPNVILMTHISTKQKFDMKALLNNKNKTNIIFVVLHCYSLINIIYYLKINNIC